MADLKKNPKQIVQIVKMYGRVYRESSKPVRKNMLKFVALRVAFALFFRAKSKKK